MRIGTWNLDNKWSDDHRDFLLQIACDIWLLTEVKPQAIDKDGRIAGFQSHTCAGRMASGQYWAAIASPHSLTKQPDPHFASATVLLEGTTYCASILPWKGGLAYYPGRDDSHGERTAGAIEALIERLPRKDVVWGGDWNHSFRGSEVAGSNEGRECLRSAIATLQLQLPTTDLPHRLDGCYTIDHIAVPQDWIVRTAERVSARSLSDHDAYVVEVELKP